MRKQRAYIRRPPGHPYADAPDVPTSFGPGIPRVGRVDPVRQAFTAGVPQAPDIPLSVERAQAANNLANQQVVIREDKAQSEAAYQDVVNRGVITPVQLEGRIASVQTVAPPVNVIAFTVPERWVFRCEWLSFEFNDLAYYLLDPQTNLPWQLMVNSDIVGNVGETNARPFQVPPGTNQDPLFFGPLWVKGGDTVAVVLTILPAVTIEVNVTARLGGELMRPHSMKLGRPV